MSRDLDYLRLLAGRYPTIQAAATEIIALNASLHLPKATEHFVSDIHGEAEAFLHVLKNGSGSIKRKIDETFANELSEAERQTLASLVYYPAEKLSLLLPKVADEAEWYRLTLFRLVQLGRRVASKYTRADVRAALPPDFAAIIEELLREQEGVENRQVYYQSIIEAIIDTGVGSAFVVAMAELIQRLAIARLHIIGDIYDRGPGAHLILDRLLDYHGVDVQWGNHDIVWMGAAAGSEACMANVIRLCLRYGNLETLETGYAISLLPLASLAVQVYGDDPCERFRLRPERPQLFSPAELQLMAQMHKAITIIQLKLEAQLILRRPEYQANQRLLLDQIDYQAGLFRANGQEYPLLDRHFPTVDPAGPFRLSLAEQNVVERLTLAFANSHKLQQHTRFLFAKGSLYLTYNGNLLYHGCIPLNEDGSFMPFELDGQRYQGKAFFDWLEQLARQGYFASDPAQKQQGLDSLWYLWAGSQSPLFGKQKMATFERYWLADPALQSEKKNPYYDWRDRPESVTNILLEFGLDPQTGHIINGHVPVRVSKGESPIKAGGRLFVIDGGFAKAYQRETGIAGYTLISNSYGLLLAAHQPFESRQKAIEAELDIHSKTEILETNRARIWVKDTDQGRLIQARIADLTDLLRAYRSGLLKSEE